MSDFDGRGRRIPDYDEVEAAYWEKHPPLFWCEECKAPVTEDKIGCAENQWCDECQAKWEAEEIARLKPLYDGEKLAGLLGPEHYRNAQEKR